VWSFTLRSFTVRRFIFRSFTMRSFTVRSFTIYPLRSADENTNRETNDTSRNLREIDRLAELRNASFGWIKQRVSVSALIEVT
jgi:hypothetical protein